MSRTRVEHYRSNINECLLDFKEKNMDVYLLKKTNYTTYEVRANDEISALSSLARQVQETSANPGQSLNSSIAVEGYTAGIFNEDPDGRILYILKDFILIEYSGDKYSIYDEPVALF